MRNVLQQIKYFILWVLTPFQYIIQKFGNQPAKIRPFDVENILRMVQPGDILLSYEERRPTSVAIPGIYKHAAIVSDQLTLIEAVGDEWVKDPVTGARINKGGVREENLTKWLYQMDKVCLIRPALPKELRDRAAANSRKYIGTSYDYQFRHGSEKIYCSELVYICYVTEWSDFLKDEGDDEILPQRYRDLTKESSFLLHYEYVG